MPWFTHFITEARTREPGPRPHVIIGSMRRTLKTLAILTLVALMPLRAVAAVTVGLCAAGHDDPVAAAHGSHGHGAGAEQHGSDGASSCDYCVEHCSGAAFAPDAVRMLGAAAVGQARISFVARFAPALLTDPLDRPPLA